MNAGIRKLFLCKERMTLLKANEKPRTIPDVEMLDDLG
jgi:hypothetical protein